MTLSVTDVTGERDGRRCILTKTASDSQAHRQKEEAAILVAGGATGVAVLMAGQLWAVPGRQTNRQRARVCRLG